MSLKKGTIMYREEVVAECYECPHCHVRTEEIEYGTWTPTLEHGDVVTCESCGEEYVLEKEDWYS